MSTALRPILGHAANFYGLCAKSVKRKAAASGFTPIESERVIGLGIASEWARWAQLLKSIKYSIRKRSTSEREHELNELTRFTFMWIAANALFARSSIIELLEPSAGSKSGELDRFKVLYRHCGLPVADIKGFETALQSLLATQTNVSHFPWPRQGSTPTVLEIIFYKYTVPDQQSRGIGKRLKHAVASSRYSNLDLPTLVYATRNWNIHGVILASSFRGPIQRFHDWIDTINIALARILAGAADALHKVI